ncbi:hypothetical protein P692DRAFT_201783179, partial [Suillus brevipes Sb2]
MRVSSAVVLAVVAALTSSTSAEPAAAPDTVARAESCFDLCPINHQYCNGCFVQTCVSPLVVFRHVTTWLTCAADRFYLLRESGFCCSMIIDT